MAATKKSAGGQAAATGPTVEPVKAPPAKRAAPRPKPKPAAPAVGTVVTYPQSRRPATAAPSEE